MIATQQQQNIPADGPDLLADHGTLDDNHQNDSRPKSNGETNPRAETDEQKDELQKLQREDDEAQKLEKERDEAQKVLLEGIVSLTQKETDLRTLIAKLDESARMKRRELKVILNEKVEAERSLAATEEENDNFAKELSRLTSIYPEDQSETGVLKNRIDLQQPAEAQTPHENGDIDLIDQILVLEEPLLSGSSSHLDMDNLIRENDKLRSFCARLQREKTVLTASSNRKVAKTEEKMKIVATLASSHLTGRMGLEARLQACEKDRLVLSVDKNFLQAQDELLAIKKNMEIRALNSEVDRLRRMLNDAREAQRIAQDEIVKLAQLELDADSFSEGFSCSSNMGSSVMGESDISDS